MQDAGYWMPDKKQFMGLTIYDLPCLPCRQTGRQAGFRFLI
ncbi:MAG: hypothetical protein ACM34M_05550 [Ignavibacteria bacterium]